MSALSPPRIAIKAIAKSFGPTRAVAQADLLVAPGEVHTLLGENGSGKSTLVKILGGIYRPDAGSVELDCETITLRDPADARKHGIATVFQEVLTAGAQSVLDNVWLGSDGIFGVTGASGVRRSKAAEVLKELLGRTVDLDAPAETLSLSDRQALSIARALVSEPRLLILDESTASLDIATRDRLFGCIRRLTQTGVSVMFISHRMDEIQEISDTITVLRSGRTVATVTRGVATPNDLLHLMTGADPLVPTDRTAHAAGTTVARADQIRLTPSAEPFDVVIRAGEIIGLAGLEGQGQDAFLKRLAGLAGGDGTILATPEGEPPMAVTRRRAKHAGIAYLPRERRGESLFSDLSIRENFALPTIREDSRFGWWSPDRTSQRFASYAADLRVRMNSDRDPISSLSGGNQQKVLMSRWLATKPRILLLNDPTRGVDLGTKRELYALLDRLTAEGLCVVMLSSEMDELIELMHRVLVFRDQTLAVDIPRASLTRQRLVSAYFGEPMEELA